MNNAVSTLVVRALPSSTVGAPKYWLRKVRVITLAEVSCNYKDDERFRKIYDAWLESQVVIRKRKTRGVAGKGKGKGAEKAGAARNRK